MCIDISAPREGLTHGLDSTDSHSCPPQARRVYDRQTRDLVDVPFTRFSVSDTFNYGMNSVDTADQLRDSYRMDGPNVRHRKWWWVLFLWGFGTALTNAYIICW